MEEFMKNRAVNIQNLRSDWKIMPKEYSAARFRTRRNPTSESRVDAIEVRRTLGMTQEEQERDR
jgi:hypothetical protein